MVRQPRDPGRVERPVAVGGVRELALRVPRSIELGLEIMRRMLRIRRFEGSATNEAGYAELVEV